VTVSFWHFMRNLHVRSVASSIVFKRVYPPDELHDGGMCPAIAFEVVDSAIEGV
jgi:hypothetical protein